MQRVLPPRTPRHFCVTCRESVLPPRLWLSATWHASGSWQGHASPWQRCIIRPRARHGWASHCSVRCARLSKRWHIRDSMGPVAASPTIKHAPNGHHNTLSGVNCISNPFLCVFKEGVAYNRGCCSRAFCNRRTPWRPCLYRSSH
jgi:hypothetical protein